MCGIAGAWRIESPIGETRAIVSEIIDLLEHRGPDASGLWQNQSGELVLGHRRLSIQDLSENGAQPMKSQSERYIIVFNGEIYNFKKLSSELSTLGVRFEGHSDTEVILAGFETWGITSTIEKLTGMFAIALFDTIDEQLWFFRDRMGEKPLYLYPSHSGIVFSSELDSLVQSLKQKLVLDKNEISTYFRYGYFSVSATPFKGIHKLLPGTSVCFDKTQLMNLGPDINNLASPFWKNSEINVQNKLPDIFKNEDDVVKQFESRFFSVLHDQSIADVNLGVFLSGGIDSSLVAACSQHISDTPINTFTIAFDNDDYNEAPFAAAIAKHIGSAHIEIPLSVDECLHTIQKLPDLLDEPFADSSIIPTYLVCREARKHVTVCLSGDGGDELFAGYNRYISGAKAWRSVQTIPYPLRSSLGWLLKSVPSNLIDTVFKLLSRNSPTNQKSEKDFGTKIHKIAEILNCKNPLQVYVSLMSFWKTNPLVGYSNLGFGPYESGLQNCFSEHFESCAMINDQNFYLPCDNLFKVDRAAMASSLEVRLPLLDHELITFANSLPLQYKVRDGQSKWLLRKVLYKQVPRELIERPKMGFSMPINQWLRNELRSWVENKIENDDLVHAAGIDRGIIANYWTAHQTGKFDHSNALWTLMMYLTWFEKNNRFVI
ncbi:MAG: asparagine synthase (glutamine-hydrolyzing) [Gammaproteobacteria bacterium]|nr:asparagine synthase (glutamine-hydrolyzing) [Gammaproteobacteria bacterium]MDH5728614.1 asparagine synthase (glutamine-hydrolyzing) [Gammaproteobacteria bacterium]